MPQFAGVQSIRMTLYFVVISVKISVAILRILCMEFTILHGNGQVIGKNEADRSRSIQSK